MLTIRQSKVKARVIYLTQCAILIISIHLIGCLANPITQTSRLPNLTVNLHSDPTTLIVTNDNNKHSVPTVTTRDGERDVVGTSDSGRSNNGNKRQAKKLALPTTTENLFPEKVNNYPVDEIKRLLKQMPDTLKDLYNVLNTQLDPNMTLSERTIHYHNDGDDGQLVRDESICRSRTRNILPREAPRHNSLVYIPNTDEFVQVIQAEICLEPDRECSYLQDSLPYGMTSYCSQKYAYKKLLYLDPLENRMASDMFRYPSCCSCHIRTLPFDTRSSNNGTHTVTRAPSLNSHEEVTSVSQYLGEGLAKGESLTNQTTDRSQDSKPQVSSQQRASKQVRRLTNQTLVLNDDKVYVP